ncbi:dTDP-4-dehydrorhamnose reductase [Vibrio sp. JC009]|uniref:dTDP-4-dehydrorhamnose reductase n=1 Tax=Vibrio sp. JC009 TaxID=2912314 RepID=UPI0023B0754D|nr:dTDP-4-dehydrorhamnose reductase [Vibrio sp. JC009]WED23258.1 dTDP-4-dehydrorhamnose reductase [Vibrio sp. JC009]
MKVLVTGSNGQVGYWLEKLLRDKADLLAVDQDELDITDKNAVFKTVESFQPDVVINAAAYTAVDKAEEEKELAYRVNRDGPLYLAQAANSIGASILHISTDYVFPGNKEGCYIEQDVTEPRSVYGASKLAGEQAVRENCHHHIVLRTAWVFGEHGNNFVKTMLKLADRESLSVVGDQVGGPTSAKDVATVLVRIANLIYQGDGVVFGVYHYSGTPYVSWYQFAEQIFDSALEQDLIAKKPELKEIVSEEYLTPVERPKNSKLDLSKIGEEFNIKGSDWKSELLNLTNYLN